MVNCVEDKRGSLREPTHVDETTVLVESLTARETAIPSTLLDPCSLIIMQLILRSGMF